MRRLFTLASASLAVLAGGSAVQAQHGHAHGHVSGHGGYSHSGYGHSSYGHGGYVHGGYGYGGHIHGGHTHGHIHALPLGGYFGYYGAGSPYAYQPAVSYPAYPYPSVVSTPVVTAPLVQPAVAVSPPVVTPAEAVTTSTSLKPNAIPPYTGPGVTLRLPAEYPGSVYVQVDRREVEVKPGTEVVLKDKPAYRVEFDRGGEFGTSSSDITEGVYKFKVADKGWFLVPDDAAAGGVRRNALPGDPKK